MWEHYFFAGMFLLTLAILACGIDDYITGMREHTPPFYIFGNRTKFNVMIPVYYIFYSIYLLFKVFILMFSSPQKVMMYLRLKKNGKLVRVNLNKYCSDFCLDSSYPDQIKCYKLNNFNYRASSGPLRLAKSFARKDGNFDWNNAHADVVSRFIELLPSLTLFYFSKSCKHLYYQCLEIRGLEYSFYSFDPLPPPPEGYYGVPRVDPKPLSKNGRRMGCLAVPQGWKSKMERYVICHDTFHCYGGNTLFLGKKTYRQLIVVFLERNFNFYFEYTFKKLLHKKVDTVKLFIKSEIYDVNPMEPSYYAPTLKNIVGFLNMCKSVKKIGVSFHTLKTFNGFVMLELPTTLLAGNPEFLVIKTRLEDWAKTRPDLELFRLIYKTRDYMLHENKLMHLDRLMLKRWYLIEEFTLKPFTPHFLARLKKNRFLYEMEYPYAFLPYRHYLYLM